MKKTINEVEVGDYVENAYDNDSGIARVKLDERGRKYYANANIEDVESLGSIIPVSDFDEDHLA